MTRAPKGGELEVEASAMAALVGYIESGGCFFEDDEGRCAVDAEIRNEAAVAADMVLSSESLENGWHVRM